MPDIPFTHPELSALRTRECDLAESSCRSLLEAWEEYNLGEIDGDELNERHNAYLEAVSEFCRDAQERSTQ